MSKYIIGVDGGGSKTRALLFNAKHEVIGESVAKSANIRSDADLAYNSLTMAIDTLLAKYEIKLDDVKIGIGVAGYSVKSARENLLARLHTKYRIVRLHSDCHIACLAAHKNYDGAIIICGTGIVGYVIQSSNATQIGGWGFPHGDLGGAANLGLESCRLLCKAIDKVIPWTAFLLEIYTKFDHDAQKCKNWLLSAKPSDFAEISRLLMLHISNDINAKSIFSQGCSEIRQFVKSILSTTNNLPLTLMGGLAQFYYPLLGDEFHNLVLNEVDPAYGALYLF